MEKLHEFPNTIIGVTPNTALQVILVGDQQLLKLMDGDLFEDNCAGNDRESFPKKPGIYRATVEYYFQQGYSDGYIADGESDWDFVLKDVVEITPMLIGQQ